MQQKTKVNIDIIKGLADIFRVELAEIGYNTDGIIDNMQLIKTYFTVRKRLIPMRPREVKIAQGLQCPQNLEVGYNNFINKVISGSDLNPNLSRINKKLDKNDMLFYDWDIYHFHLGQNIEDDGYVERTGDVLFAIVENDKFYAIAIMPHDNWANKDLLEIILANWPNLLNTYRIEAKMASNPTSVDIAALRKANVVTAVELSDGNSYFGRGMGYMSDGSSARAVLELTRKVQESRIIKNQIAFELNKFDLGNIDFVIERRGEYIIAINYQYILTRVLYRFTSLNVYIHS